MGKRRCLAMTLAGMICLMSASAMAVPGVINYQEKLTSAQVDF